MRVLACVVCAVTVYSQVFLDGAYYIGKQLTISSCFYLCASPVTAGVSSGGHHKCIIINRELLVFIYLQLP